LDSTTSYKKEKEGKMRKQVEAKRVIYQLLIMIGFVFMLSFASMYLINETGKGLTAAVIHADDSSNNASLILYDSGDLDNTSGTPKPGLEIHNLFNDTSNVFFYANFTNFTGDSAVALTGSACDIEFESATQAADTGPFAMANNADLDLFEYNKSFPTNGTFTYNVTCSNTDAGIGPILTRDQVRIFGPGCTDPSTTAQNSLTNNTVLCGGSLTIDAGGPANLFSVVNNNLTLDCNGTTFIGSNDEPDFITLVDTNGLIMKNCIVSNVSNGLTTTVANFNDNILIYNNTFTNISSTGLDLRLIGNITIQDNNFTNISVHGIFSNDTNNLTVERNRFCHVTPQGVDLHQTNRSITNNTLCVTLGSPANGTTQPDTNFTFSVQTIDLNRTCTLAVGSNADVGVTEVINVTPTDVNVTLNTTLFDGTDFEWNITCGDTDDNEGTSLTFNNTYGACTVPTLGSSPTSNTDFRFCPGTFKLSGTDPVLDVGTIENVTASCNETKFYGNRTADFIQLSGLMSNFTLQHCYAENFTGGVANAAFNTAKTNITLYNNTLRNMSVIGVDIRRGQGYNLTNNTITYSPIGVNISHDGNHSLVNNTILNNANAGVVLTNTSSNTLLDNNISDSTIYGIEIKQPSLDEIPTAQPPFRNTLADNTICNNGDVGILINNTFIDAIGFEELVANNSICTATTASTNTEMAKVMWTTEIHVVNATNTTVADAIVNVSDASAQNVSSDLVTNGTGITSKINITQMLINNTQDLLNKSPVDIVGAFRTEKTNLTQEINQISLIALGTEILLNLSKDATAPNVTQISPASGVEGTTFNFTASVNDTTGIQACNFFLGVGTTTNQGAMDYSLGSGVVNRTHTISSAGTYTGYANCTDNGGNIGFNETTITVSAASTPAGDGGGDSDDGGEGSGGGPVGGPVRPITGGEPTAPEETEEGTEETGEETAEETEETAEETETAEEAAEEAAAGAEAKGDRKRKDHKEEEIKDLQDGEILAVEYGLQIDEVYANKELVYQNGYQENSITIKDEDILLLEFIVTNVDRGDLTDIVFGLTNIPKGLYVNEIDPKVISLLASGQTKTVTIELESEELTESFLLKIHAESADASAIIAIGTVLEAGKGTVYYTRQKIIEETTETVIRTYKILFLLFIIPLLLLLRTTTIADERSIRRMLKDKKVTDFWRIYVPKQTYIKYNMLHNLKPMGLDDRDLAKIKELMSKEKISYEFATLIVFAKQKLIPRIFTMEKVNKDLRHHFPRVWFTSPLHDYKEDQLKRYIEVQQRKGFGNNKIRQILLQSGWKADIVKKYLNPENDLAKYVAEQRKKGKTLGVIRKQLLSVKWDKVLVDKLVPRVEVLKEYIAQQRQKGKPNEQIRKALIKAGWKKKLVYAYLNPEADLHTYIVTQLQKGVHKSELKTNLIKRGWKKEIVNKFL
jgi:parallel beta-helix repeat protein